MRPAIALVVLLAACGRVPDTGPVATPVDPATLSSEKQFLSEIDRTMGTRDCFTVVRDGRFVPAAEAPRMRDDERVLGVDLGGVTISYPILYLNQVEIVEHTAAGHDLLVCWCPLCGTGVVHERRADGRPLTFGHSGWLWRNSFLLYDRETDSLWHHATGTAMTGPLRGNRMARFPATSVMTFAAWRQEHPATLVLAKPLAPEAPVETDPYALRNSHAAWGLSLEVPGAPRFYPFSALREIDAVEDDAAGTPVVVVRDAGASLASAYDRRVGGATVSFEVVPGPRPQLREKGGTRAWFLRSGAPVAGSGAEAPLRPFPATHFERNAWEAQHPAGSTWRRP